MTAPPAVLSDAADAQLHDVRLEAAAQYVQASGTHADIGSDHARLPLRLLGAGRAARCVVVERTPGPLEAARRAVAAAGLLERCDLRLGDGFAPILPGELDSASLTGMGARTILGILTRALTRTPGVLPPALVLQPNADAGLLRRWARAHGYRLTAETLAAGFWRYPVLQLRRERGPDPVYAGLPLDAALRYGPHLLRTRHPLLRDELEAQRARLAPLLRHGRAGVQAEWDTLQAALGGSWVQGNEAL